MNRVINVTAFNADNTVAEQVEVKEKEGVDQFALAEDIAAQLDARGLYVEVEVTNM